MEAVSRASAGKGALKTGVYHACQLSAAGFGFQYKFELLEGGTYKMFDKTGTYRFDPETNGIYFLSGDIKGYKGVFTRVDHVNNTRKLMIVLSFHADAAVPDTLALDKKPGGYYQYAYFQGE